MKLRNILYALMLLPGIPANALAAETTGVVATIKPLHAIVSGVIGETGSPELMLRGRVSPHDFQLKPSHIAALQRANLVFYIDDRFETFLHNALENLPDAVRKAPVVPGSGLPLLNYREGGAWEAHDHQEHAAGEHDEEAEPHDDHHEHHAHNANLHIWLDPEFARRIVKTVTRELSAVFPENRSLYKANARNYIQQIDALETELKTSLTGLQDRPFIVFHDAYQYFERAFNLQAVGSATFEPDEAASPNRIRDVREKILTTGAGCIFSEPQFSDRLVSTIAEGTSIKTGILDPLGADLEAGGDLYFALMRNMAGALKECLS